MAKINSEIMILGIKTALTIFMVGNQIRKTRMEEDFHQYHKELQGVLLVVMAMMTMSRSYLVMGNRISLRLKSNMRHYLHRERLKMRRKCKP